MRIPREILFSIDCTVLDVAIELTIHRLEVEFESPVIPPGMVRFPKRSFCALESSHVPNSTSFEYWGGLYTGRGALAKFYFSPIARFWTLQLALETLHRSETVGWPKSIDSAKRDGKSLVSRFVRLFVLIIESV